MIPIWDIWIRLFHWSLAIAVLFLLFSGETNIGFLEWHRQIGELVLTLIVFRLIWGVIGSSNARLSQLVCNPRHTVHHFLELLKGRAAQERGHNAAGGWAVLIMLALIGFQAFSGMFIADEDELMEGALYGVLSPGISESLHHLHHQNAQFIQIIVTVHVLMVFVYLFYAKQNLIVPMITGKLRWSSSERTTAGSTPPAVHFRHWAVGAVIALVLGAILITQFYL